MTDSLHRLFEDHFKEPAQEIVPVSAHASDRKIYRLRGARHRAIGVLNANEAENRAFVGFAHHFKSRGVKVPEIFGSVPGAYLQTDLGDLTLYQAATSDGNQEKLSAANESLYRTVLKRLKHLQFDAAEGLNYDLCYPLKEYGAESVKWDLSYFERGFLQRSYLADSLPSLSEDFETLTKFLGDIPRNCFMHRDFQARNIMLTEGEPYIIDFQSGRKGTPYYDLATLLLQSKINITPALRESFLEEYRLSLPFSVSKEEFSRNFLGFVLIQFCHRLGAYGKLGIGMGKSYFLDSIVPSLLKLKEVMTEFPLKLPALESVLKALWDEAEKGRGGREFASPSLLTVTLGSFSYKKGVPLFPIDRWESGGGFVFDCRSLPNPGREARFKTQNGCDPEVISYLQASDEVQLFKQHTFALAEGAVKNFLARKFKELVISFGCTGGQHRSVYFAEQLRKHLLEQYPVAVQLSHREQSI